MYKKYEVLEKLEILFEKENNVSAKLLGDFLKIDRSTASRYLNELEKEGYLVKIPTRPVKYNLVSNKDIKLNPNGKMNEKLITKGIPDSQIKDNSFKNLIGESESLQQAVQKAKAAILYPPNGLHTLILGETGAGKSYFAEKMHEYAIASRVKASNSPFVTLNCADYSDNPQLLLAQIFGSKKGSYTGAEKDKEGLLKVSNGGILFLDEVHRLSHQGQEMLFTYIDNGVYRELGSVSNVVGIKVQIIAATTEEPDSFLLDTFRRRIPMVIELPPLSKRSFSERYELISHFIIQESKRISKAIYFSRNALISFLMYQCKNNIGQLKSDIQLSCAKGFLNFMANEESYIKVRSMEIPEAVKKGLFRYKEDRDVIDRLIPMEKELIKFHYEEAPEIKSRYLQESKTGDFYNNIDKKMKKLKEDNLDNEEIKNIIGLDLEQNFNEFIQGVTDKSHTENLMEIVGKRFLDLTDELLAFAEFKLGTKYKKEIYGALAMHLKAAVERVENLEPIFNPKLSEIRINYPQEFFTAMECARIIENSCEIILPIDEIGYLTMFLIERDIKDTLKVKKQNVSVLVVMHGKSTATSMVEVVNELIGSDYASAIDMPLSISANEIYNKVKTYIKELNNPQGVLLMVDMGSLANFSDMLYEEEGIISKTIDMTSTPLLLDVTRKAMMGQSLGEIVDGIKSSYSFKEVNKVPKSHKKLLILTACFSGEGAAERLKRILIQKIKFVEYVEIKTVNILNRKELLVSIDHYKEAYKLIAVVSTIDIDLGEIPVFNALEILEDNATEILNDLIEKEKIYLDIVSSIRDNISLDSERLMSNIRFVIEGIESRLSLKIHKDSVIGLILHIVFMIDGVKSGEALKMFPELNNFQNKYGYEMKSIKEIFNTIEKEYEIYIKDDEIAYITKIVINNQIGDI